MPGPSSRSAPPALDGPALRHLRGLAARAVPTPVGLPAGPVHVNFPFDKPLEPAGTSEAGRPSPAQHPLACEGTRRRSRPSWTVGRRATPRPGDVARAERDASARREAGRRRWRAPTPIPARRVPRPWRWRRATGFPLLADPLSGARFRTRQGRARGRGYDLFLRDAYVRERLAPDLILRVGRQPDLGGAPGVARASQRRPPRRDRRRRPVEGPRRHRHRLRPRRRRRIPCAQLARRASSLGGLRSWRARLAGASAAAGRARRRACGGHATRDRCWPPWPSRCPAGRRSSCPAPCPCGTWTPSPPRGGTAPRAGQPRRQRHRRHRVDRLRRGRGVGGPDRVRAGRRGLLPRPERPAVEPGARRRGGLRPGRQRRRRHLPHAARPRPRAPLHAATSPRRTGWTSEHAAALHGRRPSRTWTAPRSRAALRAAPSPAGGTRILRVRTDRVDAQAATAGDRRRRWRGASGAPWGRCIRLRTPTTPRDR